MTGARVYYQLTNYLRDEDSIFVVCGIDHSIMWMY